MSEPTLSTTPHDPRSGLAYRLAFRTAVVAGVFSAVVLVLLAASYGRRVAKDPLETPRFKELKAQLVDRPQDEALKKQIRQMDLDLRQAYFRQRRFAEAGWWLFLGGLAVCLIALKWASALRRTIPMPPQAALPEDHEARAARVGRFAVGGLTAVLVLATVGLALSYRGWFRDLALPPQPAAVKPVRPPAPYIPSDEEVARAWPRFRGPDGSGISIHPGAPTRWNGATGEGILWKTPVPLEGNNSPVVWNDRVFLSGATEDRREVYCFDANSGKLLWQKPVPGTPQSTAKPPEVSNDTGYAASTTTTDGRRVYAVFANGDLGAWDYSGRLAWARSLGIPENSYGHASSLAMYRNLLVVQFDQAAPDDKKSKIMGLDAASGKTVWETPREVPNSWTSPIVVRNGKRMELITAADPWVISYNPADGKEIWRFKGMSGDCGPSPVFSAGVAYAGNEYCYWFAIKADGQGDVTSTNLLWKGEDGLPDECSPLVTDKYVLLVSSAGVMTCYAVADGKMLWEHEFDNGEFVSSPSLAEGKVYLFDKKGKCFILEPGPEDCKVLAENELGEECVTSPAFQPGRMYIRGRKNLFCMGKK